MEIVKKFEISYEAIELLKRIGKEGNAEYRDFRYKTLDSYMNQEGRAEFQTEERYKSRNAGGTAYLIYELEEAGLVDMDDMAWHPTYVLTEFGKEQLEKLD